MTLFQKIQNCLIGALLIFAAVILFLAPSEAIIYIPIVIGLTLLVYGSRFLVLYLRMAKHMVGGKSILYKGIIIMDAAIFTTTIAGMNNKIIVLIYLLGIYAFAGVVALLRSLEVKQTGADGWKTKLAEAIGDLLFVVALIIIGFVLGREDIFVYGYCASLIYSGLMKIIGAFKKTAIVYIQ